MAEKEICNTRLLNWTYTNLEAFLVHSQKPYEPISIFLSCSLFSLCLSSSVASALDRLPTVFVLQGILAANFSGKGHIEKLEVDFFFTPNVAFFCV